MLRCAAKIKTARPQWRNPMSLILIIILVVLCSVAADIGDVVEVIGN
jgi:hypothetical protein